MAIIENVTFMYTKIQSPGLKYGSKTEKQYTVDIAVPKAFAKTWNKTYVKQKAKEFDNDEFKEQFKIDAPFPEQDEQYVIKLKRDAQFKSGDPIPDFVKPRVLLKTARGLEDITQEKLVANGSKGSVSYEEYDAGEFGMVVRLKDILVTNLIEYVPTGGGMSEFGAVTGKAVVSDFAETQQAAPEAKEEVNPPKDTGKGKKAAPKAPQEAVEDFDDSDIPF